jgi:hypothetical protein
VIGRFLELSLPTADIGAAWQRWLSLGFTAGEAGDVWKHPYGVVACEGLAVGLHAVAGDAPLCVSFVRSGVEKLERELSHRLIGIERAQLGGDVFNLLELYEPGGTLLRVQEARSFSPPAEMPRNTSLGRFRALSLPCPDLDEARGFWERLDLEVRDIQLPWDGLAIAGLPIACHGNDLLEEPVLVFDQAGDSIDDEALREAMLGAPRAVPGLRAKRHRLLRTRERLAILLLGAAG